ncbi:uncharacterized protein LOC128209793 [Mya arenaria]|uniref:uncharacterized protein LOC128209793 n=1 Tax=Mya arenaria TaxID=6604 RepID=UPI0022DFA056|nr:uncharacterized protein LOC128209793 [Mya arenaria]
MIKRNIHILISIILVQMDMNRRHNGVIVLLMLEILLFTKSGLCAVSCPSGDAIGTVRDGQTCAVLVAANNGECYDAAFETQCCDSCNGAETTDTQCRYGDRASACLSLLCITYNDPSECCDTCNVAGPTSQTEPPTTVTSQETTTSSTTTTTTQTVTSLMNAVTQQEATTSSEVTEDSPRKLTGGEIAAVVICCIVVAGLTPLAVFGIRKWLTRRTNRIQDGSKQNIVDDNMNQDETHPPPNSGDTPLKVNGYLMPVNTKPPGDTHLPRETTVMGGTTRGPSEQSGLPNGAQYENIQHSDQIHCVSELDIGVSNEVKKNLFNMPLPPIDSGTTTHSVTV